MKEANYSNKEKNQYIHPNGNKIPNIIIEEDNLDREINPYSKKKKKEMTIKREVLPLITSKNENKKNSIKSVKNYNNTGTEKISQKCSILKFDLNHSSKNKKTLNLNTERLLLLDNNDSSSENIKKKDSKIDKNKTIPSEEIFPYSIKSKYLCKNKKKMKNDSESLNDVFKKLMDIKHKIRNVKTEKKNKICQFNSNLSNINKSEKIEHRNNYNQNDYHYSRNNNNNTYYNTHFHTFNSNIRKPQKRNEQNKTKILKTNINLVNFRKSASSFKRFNEHIKYILHIRQSEMSALFNQFQKALEENEKEKDFHYKNRVFPLEIIKKLIKIKDDLTISKYRNEYFKRLDRYDIHPLKIFLDNEKKNVNLNKAKIFKGLFLKISNIK